MARTLSSDDLARLPACAATLAAKGLHARYLGDTAIRHYRERTLADLRADLGEPGAGPLTIHGGIGTLTLRPDGNAWTPAPALGARVAGLAGATVAAVASAVAGREVFADVATRDARLAACAGCDLWRAAEGRCSSCGCVTAAKVALADSRCPLGKW